MERTEGFRGTQKCAEVVVQIYANLLILQPSDVSFHPDEGHFHTSFAIYVPMYT